MDAIDKALHLPLRRPLPDLSQFGLVPDPDARDLGRASWVAIADWRSAVTTKRTVDAMVARFPEFGLTLEGYLRGQLERLRAEWAAVAPIRLYLRAPGEKQGRWTRAWLGMPHAGVSEPEVNARLQEVLAKLLTRTELAGHTLGGRPCRKPDRPVYSNPTPSNWLQERPVVRGSRKITSTSAHRSP